MDKKKLKQIFSDDPEVLQVLRKKELNLNFSNVHKKLDTLKEPVKITVNGTMVELKGEKGNKGNPPTKEELLGLIKPLIPDPIKGDSYILTEKDKEEIAQKINVPIVEKIIEKTLIKEPIITNEIKEVAVKDTAIQTANKLNTLKEKINVSVIRGLPTLKDWLDEIKKGKLIELRDIKGARLDMNDMRWHGGGISDISGLITAGAGITITGSGTTASPYSISTGVGVGTVTSVSVATANGFSGTVATATTTPVITIIAGAITPTSVNGITFSGSGSIANTGTTALTSFTGSGTTSGTNTGDQTLAGLGGVATTLTLTINGTTQDLSANRTWNVGTVMSIATTAPITGGTITGIGTIAITKATGVADGYITAADWNTFNNKLTSTLSDGRIFVGSALNVATPVSMSGDATLINTGALTLATVNANVGTFGNATQASVVTVNAKGLVTAASNTTITPAVGSITGLGSGVATWLATPSSANLASAVTGETGTGALVFGTSPGFTTAANPVSDDGATLGTTALEWSDLFLASGAVINYANGNVVLTHTSAILTLGTGTLKITTPTNTTTSVVTIDGTQTLTNKTIGVSQLSGSVSVANGGTGLATLTANAVILGQGTSNVTFATIGTSGRLLIDQGAAADPSFNAMSGDATIINTGVLTIGNNKVTLAKFVQGSAQTMLANNTAGTANFAETPFYDVPLATYGGTITWNGTPPTTIVLQQYAWSRQGNTVHLWIGVEYTNAGTTNTSATFTLPTDCPNPVTFAGWGDAASEIITSGTGRIEGSSTAVPGNARAYLQRNAANNGYIVGVLAGSASAKVAAIQISYRVS